MSLTYWDDLRETQMETARAMVKDQMPKEYLGFRSQTAAIIDREIHRYVSQIENAAKIIKETLEGKTQPAILKILDTLIKDSPKFLDGVFSILIDTSYVNDSNRGTVTVPTGPLQGTNGTNKILMDDKFLEVRNPLENAKSILKIIKDLNESLIQELTIIYRSKVLEIATGLSELEFSDVDFIAKSERLIPKLNIKEGKVKDVSKLVTTTTNTIEDTIGKINKAYNAMQYVDEDTASIFKYTDGKPAETIGDKAFGGAIDITGGALDGLDSIGLPGIKGRAANIGGKGLAVIDAVTTTAKTYNDDVSNGRDPDDAALHGVAKATAKVEGGKVGAAIGLTIVGALSLGPAAALVVVGFASVVISEAAGSLLDAIDDKIEKIQDEDKSKNKIPDGDGLEGFGLNPTQNLHLGPNSSN